MHAEALAALDAAIASAEPGDRAALVVALAARLAVLGAGLAQREPVPGAEDRNLSVPEAAKRLGMSARYLYRHSTELGGVRFGRRLVFPERALARGRR